MRTAAITIVAVIIGCSLLLSGCFPQPSARELFNQTHFNYSVVKLAEEREVNDDNEQAEAASKQAVRLAQAPAVDPATIDAVFEANADIIRYCVKGLRSR